MAAECVRRHTARVVDRDGEVICPVEKLVDVRWQRVLNASIFATVVAMPAGDCCDCMSRIRPWRHQLMIWRGGKGVWSGPVLEPVWGTDGRVTITAFDILAWLDARTPHRSRAFTGVDLAEIGRWLIRDGFLPDDPGHQVQIIGGGAGIVGDREYEADVEHIGDHLRDLSRTGLDFTALGTRILLMPRGHHGSVGRLTDQDFPDGLEVREDGFGVVTRAVVWGAEDRADGTRVKGVAGGVDPYYGLVERVYDEPSILDDFSARAAARGYVAAWRPSPVWLETRSATLSPDAAVDVARLVPGWCVDVATTATCRTITQRLKLASVQVRETGQGETVAVNLQPVGTVDGA